MFSGMPIQPVMSTAEKMNEVVDNKPQPKNKKEGPARLANEMIKCASYLVHLQIQSHLVHLNFEASNFLGVHEFTERQYKKHTKQLDRVGELIRSLDFLLPMCAKGLMGSCKGFKHIDSYDPGEMLMTYKDNLEQFGMSCKKIIKLAQKEDAPDVEHYFAKLVEEMFTASWKIKSTLRNKGSHCGNWQPLFEAGSISLT